MSRGLNATKRLEPREPGRSRPSVDLFLGLLMVAAVLTAIGVVVPSLGASALVKPAAQSSAPPCPTGDSCVTIPCSTGACPTVEAGPTSNVGTNPEQYMFVYLYDFPAGDSPEIDICTDTEALSEAAPMCSTAPGAVYAPIFSDGTGFITYQVTYDPDNGGSPIPGEVLGNDSEKGTFYCDNGPHLCSLVVFDQNLNDSATPDTSNTAVLPISYNAGGNGCSSSTIVNTESDFGIEGLLGDANVAGCKGSNRALAFNTALDSLSAVTALNSGSVQIAFTDDPQAADEQAELSGHYALIPVAVSADVMGFSAEISPNSAENRTLYPHTTFELTPNMVAGLVNSAYDNVGSADTLAGTKCANPGVAPPKTLNPCPAMESLNSVSGFLPEEEYQAYVRSDNAGVTDELLQWLCAAPDHTVPIAGKNVNETYTAAGILEATKWSDSSLDGTCPDTDQFPALGDGATLNADSDPQDQAKALYSQVEDGEPPRQAGFADMNWYEALYYGLIPAELQNAAGQFVAPSEASVDAALADATVNADGSLSFDYTNTSDAAAYPQPVVFYAAVSTSLQPSAEANAERRVLDNVLALTASGSSATLPPGILPLTSSLTTAAEADVAKDIHAEASPSGTKPGNNGGSTGTSTSTSTPVGSHPSGRTSPGLSGVSPGSSSGSAGSSSSGQSGDDSGVLAAHTTGTTARTSTTGRKGRTPKTPSRGGVFHAIQVALAAPEWRWLLVGMLAVGAIAVSAGPLLLVAQRLRRRLAVLRRSKD